jgi:glycerol uptake facilitator-like aquaporin
VFLAFFIILILSAPISGSHYNPAVTLAFMFKRDTGRFSRMLGFFYIIFQYIGALGGGILIFDILNASARLGIEHNGLTPTYWT